MFPVLLIDLSNLTKKRDACLEITHDCSRPSMPLPIPLPKIAKTGPVTRGSLHCPGWVDLLWQRLHPAIR
ncbi:hypothetical protein BGLT_02678 [Caballeronia glathei]|nr:hypothetical protein BGLT_02678 [Caballeronia glathei]